MRDPSGESELFGLPELVLEGLDEPDARGAVRDGLPRPSPRPRPARRRDTRHPLALLELPRGLSRAELGGWVWPAGAAVDQCGERSGPWSGRHGSRARAPGRARWQTAAAIG